MNKLLTTIAGIVLALSLTSAQATSVNVGGVIWDPDQTFGFPNLPDFFGAGSLVETATTGVNSIVTGNGSFSRINSQIDNPDSFCPGCELTFTFSMVTDSIVATGPTSADFAFRDLLLNIYVDHTPDYIGTGATASDGDLWLSAELHGLLTGTGEDIGTGSDTGEGSGLLNVIGGMAMGNFDTDSQVDGTDIAFSSSFQPILDANGRPTGLLSGTWEMTANTIPEPETLALLGAGLIGLGALRRNKK